MGFGFKIKRMARCCMASIWMVLAAANAMAAAPEVVRAEFGLFTPKGASDLQFEPTRIVPHKAGTRYGWVIELRSDKRRLDVSEEYLLSAPAQSETAKMDATDGRVVSFARRNPVSHRQLVPRDGLIFGEWEIGPDEPPGKRHLQVLIEGEAVADFEYEVREVR